MRRAFIFLLVILALPLRADDDVGALPTDDPQAVALYRACMQGDADQVRDLIQSGAPVDGPVGTLRFTPLIAAAYKAHLHVLQMLLDFHASVNLVDKEGSTPLLHACSEAHTDCALALINAGADVNTASHAGRTPLMYVAKQGDDQTVQALIAHKVSLDAVCSQGSAISWAASNNHLSTVKLLGDAGANPNLVPQQKTSLTTVGDAIANKNVEMIDYLISIKADVNTPDKSGMTPLFAALWFNSTDAATDLLGHGANPDLLDQFGETPLMRAAEWGRTDVVRALLSFKANVNLANAQGETALTLAGSRGDTDIVDILKSAGATRTDLHIIIKPTTKPAVAPPQEWALAVGAIYTLRDGDNPRVLGGDDTADRSRKMLKDYWGITDKASLFKELDDLRDSGHHAAYRKFGAELDQMTDDQFKQLLEAHFGKAVAITAQRDSYRKWKDRTGLAWDLCRSANLVNNAYAAGYIGEDEAWPRLMQIAQTTQGSFKSWQEMSDNFLDGREIWANDLNPGFGECATLLLNAQDPNSPWTRCAWATPLAPESKAPVHQ